MTKDMAPGFRRSTASGLILPEPLSRTRVVFTDDESRTIARATKLLEARGIQVYFGCPHKDCRKHPMEPKRTPGGDFALDCECSTFTFTRAF